MKLWRTIAGQTGVQLVGKAITVLATLLLVRLIAGAGEAGQSTYGLYAIATTYVAYFYLLADFGLNAIYVRRQESGETETTFGDLVALRLALSGGLVFVSLAVALFLPYPPAIKAAIVLLALTIVSQSLVTSANGVFQATARYGLAVLAAAAGSGVTLALAFASYRWGWGLTGYVVAFTAGSGVMAVLAFWLARPLAQSKLRLRPDIWRGLLLAALPLGLTMVLNIAYFKSDLLLLSLLPLDAAAGLSNERAAALYALAYKVFENLLVLPIFLVNALYPFMVRRQAASPATLGPFVRTASWVSAGLGVVLAAIVWFGAPTIISVLADGNGRFDPSVEVLRLLALSLPVFFISNVLLWTLITLKAQGRVLVVYAVAAVLNVGLNLWLLPTYTITAAAITTGITESFCVILLGALAWSSLRAAPATLPVEPGEGVVS